MDAAVPEITDLMESVTLNGKQCHVSIQDDSLNFVSLTEEHGQPFLHIPLKNILAVRTCESTGKTASLARKFSKKNGLEIPLPHSLKVYSSKISRSGKWKVCKLCIVCSSQQQSQSLLETVTTEIRQYVSLRPRHLMVIVNPRGGRRKGEKIYRKHVANIFNLLDIKTEVFVTNYQQEARELVLERDLSEYDGIVGVGGDGTANEIVNALLTRTQNEADLDLDDPDVQLVRPKLKIGIIPAGSTDVIAFDTTGVNDPVTSALQIAQGFSVGLDVCSVHHNNYLLRYTLSFLGYGFFGDVVKESENFRWMGPNRYGLAGFLKYMGNRSYHGIVSYLPNDDHSHSPWDSEICTAGCLVCKEKGEYIPLSSEDVNLNEPNQISTTKDSNKWEMKHGDFNAINAAILSCTSLKAPGGVSPAAHLGNGCVDLVLVKRCSRLQYLRYMLRIALNGNPLNLDYVEVHRVKAFKFQTMPVTPAGLKIEQGSEATAISTETSYMPSRQASVSSTSSWNLDGEISDQPDIDVRVHCQLIQLFARGPDIPEKKKGSSLSCFH